LKGGFKYKEKDRTNTNTNSYSPYYLGYFRGYQRLADGSIVPKSLSGSYFDSFYQEYLKNSAHNAVSFSAFLDDNPESREMFGKYNLNPLINRDKLRQWYDLNKNGVDKTGVATEYYNDPSVKANYYDITETVTSGYLMNTLNFGQDVTFIAGLRVESEDNHYNNKYSKTDLSGFPVPLDKTRDTTANYKETIYLPNFQVKIKATDFMNVRFAAYRALARPDFNMRLNTYFAWRPSDVGSVKQLILGNPILKTAKAWNFEVNTSFYGNDIGLISLSAFYKEIKDMYHMLNQINTVGNVLLESLNLDAKTIHQGSYQLTVPYNSPKPSKVWGIEFEHQINFTFLPGWLQNFVLSYNFSVVRSETWLIGSQTDTTYVVQPPFPFPTPQYSSHAVEYKQQLEEQPEFYGNISLGYDIDGFSIRLSMFHQSEYNISFSSTGRSDNVRGAYTRFDLAAKQKFNEHISLQLNINNLTNIQEDNYLDNRVNGYKILRSSELYGLSGELGVRIDL
jgi:TonB-dependent receptor